MTAALQLEGVTPAVCAQSLKRSHMPMPVPARSQLVMEVLKHLEGAYALLFKSSLYPGEMVACKRGSPLILGIREAPDGSSVRLASVHDESLSHAAESLECFIASDASAVVEHTKKCARVEGVGLGPLSPCQYGRRA
jgi:glutamine---fructose-6-phosphate transaminase (isomerizing)